MKRIIVICLLIAIAIPTWSLAAAIGPARVRLVDGETLFMSPDSDEWLPATVNTPLDEGDAIWCPDGSRTEIQLPDGSIVRLDGGSQLDMIANEDGFTHLHLANGHLYLRTIQTMKENALQIDADDTTVLPSSRTRLRIDMLPDGQEDVAVTKGSAYVEGNGNRTKVRAGEHIVLEDGHNEIYPLNPADSWEVWNVDRDRQQSRSASGDSHLPEELRGYSAELDAHGSWVSVPEYGTVWRPAGVVSDDWAPYREGRWIWRGDDYVWLSSEVWGWVPYHFGRWAVVSGFGWCWVPPARGDVYWGPGYVGWYRTGSHVGWTPLAPGEIFYGRRHYGRHSINVTSVNINTSTVIYRNRNVRGGLTVLQHDDFLRGRPSARQAFRSPPAPVTVSVGSPRIQPIRETRMPIIKQTPPRVAPPRVEHRDTRELKSRFPRVVPESTTDRRRPSQPVTTPGTTPPAGRTPQVNERKTTPAVTPGIRTPQPERQRPSASTPQREDRRQTLPPSQPAPRVVQPSQPTVPVSPPHQPPVRQQREERRQGDNRPPQAVQPPAPPAVQTPPVPGPIQQRTEQPRRPAVAPLPVPQQQSAPSRLEQPRRETATPAEMQQKKVWRVTTPEPATEREPARERDNRGRERR